MIEKSLGDYYIFEIDKNPVACVALHVYPEQKKGELACLYVNPSHENQGIGRKLIQFVENKAREMGLSELLTLSTQAFTYFQSKGGFAEGTPDDLPPARREKYEQSGRNSKVLVKKLGKLRNMSEKADLVEYYARRANEYERIYQKPERQTDLASLRKLFRQALAKHDVLEIACGTGYWTQIIAETAKSITATDINSDDPTCTVP